MVEDYEIAIGLRIEWTASCFPYLLIHPFLCELCMNCVDLVHQLCPSLLCSPCRSSFPSGDFLSPFCACQQKTFPNDKRRERDTIAGEFFVCLSNTLKNKDNNV